MSESERSADKLAYAGYGGGEPEKRKSEMVSGFGTEKEEQGPDYRFIHWYKFNSIFQLLG